MTSAARQATVRPRAVAFRANVASAGTAKSDGDDVVSVRGERQRVPAPATGDVERAARR